MSKPNEGSKGLPGQEPPRDQGDISVEKEKAQLKEQNARRGPGSRAMFDRRRRDWDRMPGETKTRHGGPDIRTYKNKGYTAQLAWREKPEVVDAYKLTAHGLGMTLSEYARWTHTFREQYAVLQSVLDQLTNEANAAGMPLLDYVKSRLGIDRQEPGTGGASATR